MGPQFQEETCFFQENPNLFLPSWSLFFKVPALWATRGEAWVLQLLSLHMETKTQHSQLKNENLKRIKQATRVHCINTT